MFIIFMLTKICLKQMEYLSLTCVDPCVYTNKKIIIQ